MAALENSGGKNWKQQSANGAAGVITASLTAAAGRTNYISGFMVDGLGATAAAAINITVNNLVTGTLVFRYNVPAGVTTPAGRLLVIFPEPIPANAPNTGVTVNVPSFGAGNAEASVMVWGYDM